MKRKVASSATELEVLRSVKRQRSLGDSVAGDHGASGGGDLRFGINNNKTPKRAGGESAAGAPAPPVLLPEVVLLDGRGLHSSTFQLNLSRF